MKMIRNKSKKGFTLVELIVVLVILAVLAAMLVPALTGYIKRAREEKEYQTASTMYSAAQAVIADMYGRNKINAAGSLTNSTADYGDDVYDLAGVDSNIVTAYTFNYDDSFIITGGSVTVTQNGKVSTYTLTITNGQPEWKATTA